MVETASGEAVMENLRKYYTVIYAQCFSPCNKYLVAASNYGEIAVFVASNFLSTAYGSDDEDGSPSREPFYKFAAHSGSIFALVACDDFLISGGSGEIFAWNWDKLKRRTAEKSWALSIPQGESIVQPEVNALVLSGKDSDQRVLIAGCGDNKVYVWDVETRMLLSTLSRHTDYVHDLALASNNTQLYSGGRGRVRPLLGPVQLKAKIDTSASSLYSVVFQLNPPHKGLCAAGSSYKIEVCTNFLYRDFSLHF
ncbi:hypothetical protein MRX96_014775 [Rhipicephalus microplus]